MLLKDAIELMKEGKQVVRTIWEEKEGYLTILPNAKFVWKIVFNNGVPNAGNFIFETEDLLADDWIELNIEAQVTEAIDALEQEQAA